MQTDVERRKGKRNDYRGTVLFRSIDLSSPTAERQTRSGDGVDISEDDRGIGIVTKYPLYSRQTLVILKDDAIRTALVRWVNAAPVGYRAGVMLV